jgi:tetratricopeptide (TPR) repeat protein
MSLAEALRALLDALGVPAAQIPAGVEAQAGLYRSLLSDRRMLVLLDNARDSGQVRPLLPGSPGNLVVVTSRSQLGGLVAVEGAWPLTLDVLGPGDARELLTSRLGPQRLDPEPDAVAELVALCAGLPLALTIVAARVSARPRLRLGEFTGELRDARRKFDALDGMDGPASVRAVFSWSMTTLSAPAVRLFGFLGIHPGTDISAPAAASLAGLPPLRTRRILDELADAHLITEHAAGRFGLHDLLRAYAAEQAAADDAACRAALGRVLGHYVHTASAAALRVNPSHAPLAPPQPQRGISPERMTSLQHALDWFEAEHEVLNSAVELAARTGFETYSWQLAWATGDFLLRKGHWHQCAAIQHVALAAATSVGDLAGQAAARRHIAYACLRLTDYAEAISQFTACLELHGRMGDRAGQARAHQALSSVAGYQGRNADSLSHAQQALALFEAIGDLAGQAGALNDVGWCHALLGDDEQARTFCRHALALNRELGIRPGEAVAWDSLGSIEQRLGHPAEAAASFRAAIALFTELGARFFEADSLTRLGDSLAAAGDAREAHEAWQRALGIFDSLTHPSAGQVRARLQQLSTGAAHTGRARHAAGSANQNA